MENRAGIRELKARLSSYLRQVRKGETLLITDRGKPVARLVPVEASPTQRLAALEQAGLIAWSGRGLPEVEPVKRRPGASEVAALLVEDRD